MTIIQDQHVRLAAHTARRFSICVVFKRTLQLKLEVFRCNKKTAGLLPRDFIDSGFTCWPVLRNRSSRRVSPCHEAADSPHPSHASRQTSTARTCRCTSRRRSTTTTAQRSWWNSCRSRDSDTPCVRPCVPLPWWSLHDRPIRRRRPRWLRTVRPPQSERLPLQPSQPPRHPSKAFSCLPPSPTKTPVLV